ncbi:MAG: SUMF1/EgtB/PvdO family nonheme iron enzyme [Nostoc sp. DcaGUA01]|nr:SUMF1/EgtB/PvdO family nonheme iron enzyme [Nostoc sp. DcaGUA01]
MQQTPEWLKSLIKWSPTGVGLGATGHFILQHDWTKVIISTVVTASLSLWAKFSEGFMQEMEAGANERGKKTAQYMLTQADNLPQKLQWKLSRFENKYYQSLIDKYIALKTEGFNLAPTTPNLEDVFVPLKVASESYRNIATGFNTKYQPSQIQQSGEIWDFLTDNSQQRCIAILAPPGSGKTTLLQYITLTYARKVYRKYKVPQLIPILLRLRDVREMLIKQEPPSLSELIQEQIKLLPLLQEINLPTDWFNKHLNDGRCLVMLDGLDEVANDSERSTVSRWITEQMGKYSKTAFILTSRRHGYESESEILGERINTVLEVQPFTLEQMKQFIQGWYLQATIFKQRRNSPTVKQEAKQEADELIEALLQNPTIRKMASNPLLVTMIATVHYLDYTLPGKRVELYKEICDVLLGRRPSVKKIKMPLDAKQNQSLLQLIALDLMRRETQKFTAEEGISLIKDKLQQEFNNVVAADQWLEILKDDVGLLIEKEQGSYEFAHLSFQEYLAAVQIEKSNQEDILIQNFHIPQWAETISLYATLSDVNDITRLIQKALERWKYYGQEEVKSLTLAYSCLQENPNKVEEGIKNELTTILEEGLESLEPQVAQIAAKVKLSSRLSQLLDIDEILSIDRSYITCAEYQLFIDEQLNSVKCFQPGNAKNPITGISYQQALEFCAWLSENAPSLSRNEDVNNSTCYYRLPTKTEASEFRQLNSWTIDGGNGKKAICIVRNQISPDYIKLTNYLAAGEWQKAAEETRKVLLKAANRETEGEFDITAIDKIPCSCLSTINHLWLQYSTGRFGWGVRESIDANNQSLSWCLNASKNGKELFSALVKKHDNCGKNILSPLFAFDVVIVNGKGKEIQWERRQAECFIEELGDKVPLEMVAIPSGKFLMGSPKTELERLESESPQHEVTVPSFFMGKYPITQAQWRSVATLPQINRELKPEPSHFKGDNLPVEQISWYEAVEFCDRLSKQTGKHYRLPSEAEWEYACRAGTTTPFHFGETITSDLANYNAEVTYGDGSNGEYRKRTTPVGSINTPNAFGLYDMHGNVWEWCADSWHENYESSPIDGSVWINQVDNDNQTRLLRGGSWNDDPRNCRSACRLNRGPDGRNIRLRFSGCGFRCEDLILYTFSL